MPKVYLATKEDVENSKINPTDIVTPVNDNTNTARDTINANTNTQVSTCVNNINSNTDARANEIKALMNSGGGSPIKSIQRGTTKVPIDDLYVNVSFSPVNIAKTMVLLNGNGALEPTGSAYALLPYLKTLTSSSMRIDTSIISTDKTFYFSWQVIEFA